MERSRKSDKAEPPEQPIEPEMQKTPAPDHSRDPATESPKDKRDDAL
jgi:hypothetical protein